MKSLVLIIITCFIVTFCLSNLIYIVAAQDVNSVSSEKNVPENEVVIHSPLTSLESLESIDNEQKEKDKGVLDNILSSGAPAKTSYEELLKYLGEEKDYLKQLDDKYSVTLGSHADGDENADQAGEKPNKNVVVEAKDDNEKKEMDTDRVSDIDEFKDGVDKVEDEAGQGEDIVENKDTNNNSIEGENIEYDSPYEAAEVFYEMEKYKKALKVYKSLKKDTPSVRDYIWAQFQIANCYRNLKKMDRALKEYQSFINRYPDSFWTDQAVWYIEDVKWWKEWQSKINLNGDAIASKNK